MNGAVIVDVPGVSLCATGRFLQTSLYPFSYFACFIKPCIKSSILIPFSITDFLVVSSYSSKLKSSNGPNGYDHPQRQRLAEYAPISRQGSSDRMGHVTILCRNSHNYACSVILPRRDNEASFSLVYAAI
jgi:hypothetical protein